MATQYASTRYAYTATATTAQAAFPVSNLNVIGAHPLTYSWRSATLALHDIVIDLGTIKTVTAIAVLNLNMSILRVLYSTDGGVYGAFTGSPFTISRDPFGAYNKLQIVQSVSARYILLQVPLATPATGAFFEIGMVWVTGTFVTLPRSPLLGMRQTPQRDSLRTGKDVAPLGPWYSTEEWRMIIGKTTTAIPSQLVVHGAETPLLLYKNLGNRAETGIYRLRDTVTFERNGTTVALNPTWEEMA